MNEFKQHIASNCQNAISVEKLNEVVGRYGWFTAARIARAHHTGESDSRLTLLSTERMIPLLTMRRIDTDKLFSFRVEDDLIDKFLQLDNYRIVADQSEGGNLDGEICTEAEFDDEDDLVSEELAEVYLLQGLKSEAIAIYRKSSLLNPKKSIYFAELIERIEKQ